MPSRDTKIRIAEPADLPALVDIYNQAVSAQATAALELVRIDDRRRWFEEHGQDKYPILVAEYEKAIWGYVYLSPYRPGRSALRQTAEVSYFVDYNHHNQGVASTLLDACIQMCPKLKIKRLFAILLETNVSSIATLKKFDFEQWAHLPDVAEIDGVEVSQVYFGRKV